MGLEKEATNNKDNNVVKLKVNTKRPEIITSQHHIDHDHDHDDQVKHADDEQVVVDVQYQYLPFVCPVCNQRFKSGQALGGHKRIHGINNKIINRRKDIDIDHQDHDDDDDDEIIGNSSISTQDDHMINIIIGDGDSSTYVKTPKRQRNLMLSSSSHKTTPPSDHHAAITLMLLAHHDHRVSVTSTAEEEEEEEEEAEEEEYRCRDCNISFPSDHISTHYKKNINIDEPLTRSIDSLRSVDHERAATHDTNGDDGGKDIDVPHPMGTASKIVFDFDLNELPHSED